MRRFTVFLLVLAWVPALADFRAGLEAYEAGDYATALSEWQPLAEQGQVEAQYNVGLIYQAGKGVPVDHARAHGWFLKAAEQGYARAQYKVAELYERGEGVEQNLVLAHLWFRQAGDQKFSDAKKRRRKLAKRMTEYEIAEAEMLARQRKRERKAAH